jgi:CspA family cold shock protein
MVQRHEGYGFVELAGGATRSCILRPCARSGVKKVRVVARTGSRGAEVVRIVDVDTRTAIERSPRRSTFDPSSAFELTGKVKWFDDVRGFGFIASDDFGRDVFVHSTTLGASGVSALSEGQAVSMRVVETPKGREAIAIVV